MPSLAYTCTSDLTGTKRTPSMRDRPTPGGGGATPPTTAAATQQSFNPQQAVQLQQYRQRLQQMHQQLTVGQQQLKELQKSPEQNQQKVHTSLLCHMCVCVCVCVCIPSISSAIHSFTPKCLYITIIIYYVHV